MCYFCREGGQYKSRFSTGSLIDIQVGEKLFVIAG